MPHHVAKANKINTMIKTITVEDDHMCIASTSCIMLMNPIIQSYSPLQLPMKATPNKVVLYKTKPEAVFSIAPSERSHQ